MNLMKTEKQLIQQFLELKDINRFDALTQILKFHGIEYEVEEYEDGVRNVIVSMTDKEDYLLLVAHYDLFPGSTGINDNTASIAVLINVILSIQANGNKTLPFKVLFPDKEESGMVGSSEYINRHGEHIIGAFVLDIVGYGDTLVHGSVKNEAFDFLTKYNIIPVDTILPSDNLIFNANAIPNTLIVATHKEDILSNNKGGHRLSVYPKFYESFHNRAMDGNIEVINFELISHLRDSIVDMLGVKDEL